jgi:uncharacterized protein YqeY
MSLHQTISSNIKEAMKNKDAEKLLTLRMLNAEILNFAVANNKRDQGLDDQEVITIVSREIKKRKDAIASYEQGGREELAEKERKEISILQTFMPEQIGEDEIKKMVQEIIASGVTDFGKIMGMAMGKLKGKADGNDVKRVIEGMR